MCRAYEAAKRVFDVTAAAIGLLVLWPGLLVLYLLARRSSGGSGLFVQDRAGRRGRVFRMCKFRTMRIEHVHDPDPSVVITPDHQAVTPLGRLLRKHKLDELPQLLNILAGHMSVIGPRPTVPEQVLDYDDFQRRRLEVRPGLTGLAQINGDSALSWDERIEWDVHYVDHRGPWLDLKILARTALVFLRGAECRVRRLRDVHPRAPEPAPPTGQ